MEIPTIHSELLFVTGPPVTDSVEQVEYGGHSAMYKKGGRSLSNEASTLHAVSDEAIPGLLGYEHDECGVHHLITKRLDGVGLDTHIGLTANWQSEPQKDAVAAMITDGLAARMQSLSTAGYLYRDLNLAHVVLSGNRIGLIDHEWDVSLKGNRALVTSTAGTWETMAPEEFTPGDQMSEASSVYTLGTVLLQLVHGASPFYIDPKDMPDEYERRQATRQLHVQQTYEDFSKENVFNELIARALQPDMRERPQTIARFRELAAQAIARQ